MSVVLLKNSVSSGKIIEQNSRAVGRSPDSGLYRCRYTSEGFNLKWLGIRTYVEINFTSYEFYMSLVELDVSHFQIRLSKKKHCQPKTNQTQTGARKWVEKGVNGHMGRQGRMFGLVLASNRMLVKEKYAYKSIEKYAFTYFSIWPKYLKKFAIHQSEAQYQLIYRL